MSSRNIISNGISSLNLKFYNFFNRVASRESVSTRTFIKHISYNASRARRIIKIRFRLNNNKTILSPRFFPLDMHFLPTIKTRSFNQTTLFRETMFERVESIFIHKDCNSAADEVINQRIRTVVFAIIVRLTISNCTRVVPSSSRGTNRLKTDNIILRFNIGRLPRIYSFNSFNYRIGNNLLPG